MHGVFTAAPFSTSDHAVVNFQIVSRSHDASYEHSYYDFSSAAWDNINDVLANINWDASVFKDASPEACFDAFYCVLNHCITNFVRLRVVRTNATASQQVPTAHSPHAL